jgi:HAD superfamily hydrolase (TIGR01509 family)
MGEIKGVLFDLDGTLIDSLGAYAVAFSRAAEGYGMRSINGEELAKLLNQSLSLEGILREFRPSITPEEIQELILDMRNHFVALSPDYVTLKPFAKDVLTTLRARGMKIGVATGRMSRGDGKWRELKNLEVDSMIDAVVTSGETKPKPDPASVVRCAEELGLAVSECVFVGDTKADVIAGRSAGVIVIAISSGLATREALAEEGPDFMVDCLSELPSRIEEISQEK